MNMPKSSTSHKYIVIDWLIELNGVPTRLGLLYVIVWKLLVLDENI